MTLSEIATFAGEKIGKTDSDTATFLKKSASLNYRRVWNFAPWRETVTHSTYSVLDSTRTVTLGSNVETPLAVAYGDEELMALDLPTIISQDADLLDVDRKGTPNSFYFKGRNTGGTAELDLYPMLETSGTTSLKVVEKLKCLTRNNYVVDFPPSTNALEDELRLPIAIRSSLTSPMRMPFNGSGSTKRRPVWCRPPMPTSPPWPAMN